MIDTQGLIPALEGGAMIGLACGALYLFLGRIAGISGIARLIFDPPVLSWRFFFILGLIMAGFIALICGYSLPQAVGSHPLWLAASGLLVGLGTRLGNGCTSGHGVCGLSRLSLRSLTAVMIFMAMAAITVFIMHHVLPHTLFVGVTS